MIVEFFFFFSFCHFPPLYTSHSSSLGFLDGFGSRFIFLIFFKEHKQFHWWNKITKGRLSFIIIFLSLLFSFSSNSHSLMLCTGFLFKEPTHPRPWKFWFHRCRSSCCHALYWVQIGSTFKYVSFREFGSWWYEKAFCHASVTYFYWKN